MCGFRRHSGLHFPLPVAALIAVIPFRIPMIQTFFQISCRIYAPPGWALFYACSPRWVFLALFFQQAECEGTISSASNRPWSRRRDANSRARCQPCQALSITIIGWFLAHWLRPRSTGLSLNSAFFSGVQFHSVFLGFFFFGRSAFLKSQPCG